jgi:hypothetical protein
MLTVNELSSEEKPVGFSTLVNYLVEPRASV